MAASIAYTLATGRFEEEWFPLSGLGRRWDSSPSGVVP